MPDPVTVRVASDEVLTVTADAPGSYGTVFGDGNSQWTVSAKSPLHLGAGLYRIETVTGTVSHTIDSKAVAALRATLPRATDIVSSAATVASALQGSPMLHDRFKRLAERSRSVPAALADRADKAFARLDAVEERGSKALQGIEAVVTDAESAAAAAEDAVNQLTNGSPTP